MSGPRFDCASCGVNTRDIYEYYMIQDDLWDRVALPGDVMLCIGCVEDRLGRQLEPEDFTNCPVNNDHDWYIKSYRLMSRMGKEVMV